jgi:hypothetical protein
MAKTGVADIIIPTEFERYVIERTAELAAFYRGGIVEMSDAFHELASADPRLQKGSKVVPMVSSGWLTNAIDIRELDGFTQMGEDFLNRLGDAHFVRPQLNRRSQWGLIRS